MRRKVTQREHAIVATLLIVLILVVGQYALAQLGSTPQAVPVPPIVTVQPEPEPRPNIDLPDVIDINVNKPTTTPACPTCPQVSVVVPRQPCTPVRNMLRFLFVPRCR